MAIVVDPDNLDRNQVIFGTLPQQISLYPVGAYITTVASGQTGYTSAGTAYFHDTGATFATWGVTAGDILILRDGPNAAHYVIASLNGQTILEVTPNDGFTAFASDPIASGPSASAITWAVASAGGGSITDGVTKQAIYSFAKEEWRTDGYATMLSDNLIRHEFPFEAITRESMELGGGEAHADWTYFDEYTRKKVRTGGWKDINTATASTEYTGVITLGTLDADTQVYYQQSSAQATPTDFTFQGPVNEAINVYNSAGDDRRSYLKLFARKKARTYVQSEIADIGVTQIETIVNRFPLSHAVDTAITNRDAEILGISPFRATSTALTDTDGETVNASVFRDGNATFTSSVVPGDTLKLNTGADTGYFTVLSVLTASTIRIDTSEYAFTSTEVSLDYDIFTPIIVANKTGGNYTNVSGALSSTGDPLEGILSATGQTFVTDGVAANDFLILTSAGNALEGVYVINSVTSETALKIGTTDQEFVDTAAVEFRVVEPGMYLQYQYTTVTITGTSTLTFTSTNAAYGSAPTIARASGSWATDGVTQGTVVTFASTSNNNDCYTVASVQNASVISLVPADAANIVNGTETAGASITAFDGFKRTINSQVYSFNWRLKGNLGDLSETYQFIQHQLRQTGDIDYGPGSFRGDVNDLLMSYAAPTGTTINMYIDNMNADDTNNVTWGDACGDSRLEAYVATFTINHNANMQADADTKVRMIYTSVPAGAWSTKDAVTVTEAVTVSAIAYNVGGAASRQYSYDYDGNTDGGRTAGTDASCKLIGIGLDTAQYVITSVTIQRAKGQSFTMTAALERNYSNP